MNKTNTERVGVVGLGYIGLPLALSMIDAGYDVVGVDINDGRISQLDDGKSYVTDVSNERIRTALERGFTPTTDYEDLDEVTGVAVCVPTPLRKTGSPNMSYVVDAVERLAAVVREGTTIITESTVYPGATSELVVPAFEDAGFVVGEDIFLAFSPERIDPGNEEYAPHEIPKVLGGVTDECGNRAEALYTPVFDEIIRVNSATEAELVKLLENTFRAVNIGLINELAQVAYELDVDIWSAIDAASTKPFGFMPFYPGPGLGGHCIPVDPTFLSWKANQQDLETRFIDLADRINREMPEHVVHRVTKLVNDNSIALPDARVLIVGAAYKPDVSDTRESPAHDVIQLLEERGTDVVYHDPHVPEFETDGRTYESVSLTPDTLKTCDIAVILTNHDAVEIGDIIESAPLVFDTRNATRGDQKSTIHRL
ncbi:nucleotide sugar dehydrogenase [Halovenus rubra]|uniref:Nucleotide sugar dehydrogenase n=2 Tax=Halovenus rubra TaxID=869890 RepID=A0ACC7DXA1_9EURY|nr:nucleotide sugar dehydrogenase [Halovenus rubra]